MPYKKYDRNTVWKSLDGKECMLKDLDNGHLLNLIAFTKKRNYPADLQKVLLSIARERGYNPGDDAITNQPIFKGQSMDTLRDCIRAALNSQKEDIV